MSGMVGSVWARLSACAFIVLLLGPSNILASMLPPRLSSKQNELRLTEGQTGTVLQCNLDVGDDPVSYRWLKNHQLLTGTLGYAYRGYRQVLLALHPVQREHAGTYICEASNEEGVHSAAIKVIVESNGSLQPKNAELPHTDEILSDIATSLSDVLAEGDCTCDTLFMLHSSADAPPETLPAQANLVHIIANNIISESNRVSVMTYSDYTTTKLSFGEGVNRCALRKSFSDLSHDKWATRIQPVLREAFKKLRKSKASCKVMFLPVLGSLGTAGADIIGAQHLKKIGVKIFILEVTPEPLDGLMDMASKRGDGQPYHWRVPLHIWPTIVMYMKYIAEELEGCMPEKKEIPGKCVGAGGACNNTNMCEGLNYGCIDGQCQVLQCNVDPSAPGCCGSYNQYWCGDVTNQCTSKTDICDGRVQCMNGADEDRCWSRPCPADKVARCQSSTLCLGLMDLCDGEPACPGGEDEDPRFCRSFPCPTDRPFRCRSGICIEKRSLCDGVFKDCEEGEDEDLDYCSRIHTCPETQPFKCDYGICIAERMLCDGSYNCLDATDELVCAKRSCPAERPYKCLSGLCISMDKVCNGVVDGCEDGSDESNCTEVSCPANRSFKCNNGLCIDGWLICNEDDDCGDGSDEFNCDPTTTPMPPEPEEPACGDGEFLCNSGACIPKKKICDGRKNCLDGDDEMNCKSRPCPPERPHRCGDGTCVTSAPPCDGIEHCGDASDEINCTHTVGEYDEIVPYDDTEDIDEAYDEYDGEDYIYEDPGYEDDFVPEEEPVLSTTSTVLPPLLPEHIEPKEVDHSEEDTNKDMEFVEPDTNVGDETILEVPVPEDYPAEEVEQHPQDTHMHPEDADEDDIDDIEEAETVLEDVEPPASASSEQGASASPCVAPTCTLIIAPMFVISFRYVWTR